MTPPILTLTTDFGEGGRYVAQLKGALLSEAPGAKLIDLSHTIPPQDIAAAARLLESSTPWYPEGSVHLAVVDPGVGTDRPIVAIQAAGHRYVGPDNGLFGWLAEWAEEVVAFDLAKLHAEACSATFHGRDLMAPAAARLALGAELATLGPPHEGLVALPPPPEPLVDEGAITGRIVEADRYGNLITDVRAGLLAEAPRDDRLRIRCGPHETVGLQVTYGQQPPQTLVALVGSGGMVELAIVNGDAATMLGVTPGETIVLEWNERGDDR